VTHCHATGRSRKEFSSVSEGQRGWRIREGEGARCARPLCTKADCRHGVARSIDLVELQVWNLAFTDRRQASSWSKVVSPSYWVWITCWYSVANWVWFSSSGDPLEFVHDRVVSISKFQLVEKKIYYLIWVSWIHDPRIRRCNRQSGSIHNDVTITRLLLSKVREHVSPCPTYPRSGLKKYFFV
jgi:hypothetical protein